MLLLYRRTSVYPSLFFCYYHLYVLFYIVGSLLTLGKYPIAVLKTIKQGKNLLRPFSDYYNELEIQDVFLKNYLNLLCFLLQGLPAEGM